MLSPFFTRSSSLEAMALLSSPLIGTACSTPKSATQSQRCPVVNMGEEPNEAACRFQLADFTITCYQTSLCPTAFSDQNGEFGISFLQMLVLAQDKIPADSLLNTSRSTTVATHGFYTQHTLLPDLRPPFGIGALCNQLQKVLKSRMPARTRMSR